MTKLACLKLSFLSGVLALTPFFAQAGGSAGGGGNSCVTDSKVVLVELQDLTFDPKTKNDLLKKTKLMELIGFDWIRDVSEMKSYQLAKEMIENERTRSPKAMALLDRALSSINFFATIYNPTRALSASSERTCNEGSLLAAALYKNYEVLFSVDLFNKMPLISQAGTFIHESLRQVQIAYSGNGSDKDLEDITLQIATGGPGSSLDQNPFFRSLTMNPENVVTHLEETCRDLKSKQEIYSDRVKSSLNTLCNFDLRLELISTSVQSAVHQLHTAMFEQLGHIVNPELAEKVLVDMHTVFIDVVGIGGTVFSYQASQLGDYTARIDTAVMSTLYDELQKYAKNPRRVPRKTREEMQITINLLKRDYANLVGIANP